MAYMVVYIFCLNMIMGNVDSKTMEPRSSVACDRKSEKCVFLAVGSLSAFEFNYHLHVATNFLYKNEKKVNSCLIV